MTRPRPHAQHRPPSRGISFMCDDGDGPFLEPCDGPADVAAWLAYYDWQHVQFATMITPIEEARNALHEALDAGGEGPAAAEAARLLCAMDPLYSSLVTYGARVGYALALTADRQRDGWGAWVAAAHAELARSGEGAIGRLLEQVERVEAATDALTFALRRGRCPP